MATEIKIAPVEPSKDESTNLINSSDKTRQSFWTDAAARLDRRISQLEADYTRSIWTIPVIIALVFSISALTLAVYAIAYVFKRI